MDWMEFIGHINGMVFSQLTESQYPFQNLRRYRKESRRGSRMITYQKVKKKAENHLCNQCDNSSPALCVNQIVEFDGNGIVINCSYFPPEFNRISEREDTFTYPYHP